MKGYIYLAGPYSHDQKSVRQKRFEALTKKTAELMMCGFVVFSPITHGHTIAMNHPMPTDFSFWQEQCVEILRHASKLVVLKLDGYHLSVGVKFEVEVAELLGIPVEYINE